MAFFHRLTNLFRPERHSRDLDREMAFHLSERADELVATGMTPEQAREEAQRRFGNRGVAKERTRDVDVFAWLDVFLQDLRQAARALRANRGFALVAILSLGLGIGANTAIFSLLNAVTLKTLPVNHPETLVKVTRGKEGNDVFTNPLWEQVRDRKDLFAASFAYGEERFNIANGGEARRVEGDWVSGNFFSTLGVAMALGRAITAADDVPGCPALAVLGYGFWQSEFGGATNAVGRSILMNGHSFTVIGVTDPRFFGMDVGRSVQVYLPICSEPVIDGKENAIANRSWWWMQVVARPLAGATLAQTNARLAATSSAVMQATLPERWPAEAKANYLKSTLTAYPVSSGFSEIRQQYTGALTVLMVVVLIVLLIACANVANLLLARATVRQHEAAIRLALGAGRGRLIRQMLAEAMLLAVLGAALGLLFASWGSRLLLSFLSTRGTPVWLDLTLDGRVLAFTTGVALISCFAFGLVPALRSAHADPQAALKARGRGVVGRSRHGGGWLLVAGQVALSFVLLTSAGLLLGSFRNLMTHDPGFRREGVLLLHVNAPGAPAGFTSDILGRARALAGVRAASYSLITPVSNRGWNNNLDADGYHPANKESNLSWFNGVSDGYFATMGTALIAGRDIGTSDVKGSPKVAVVSQGVARELYGAANPIGKQFRTPEGDHESEPYEIVGVVRDANYQSMRDSTLMTVYVPLAQADVPHNDFTLELRSDAGPEALIPGLKAMMAQVAPTATLEFTTMSAQLARSLNRDRLLATLAGFFGGLAVLLALIGLYGTMSYNVARRKNEIGIRLALGAARERVVQMVLGQAGIVVGAGLAVGVLLSIAATKLVASFLFGLKASDTTTWIASAAVLAGVALLAGAIPAWRASRMNPMAALREE